MYTWVIIAQAGSQAKHSLVRPPLNNLYRGWFRMRTNTPLWQRHSASSSVIN